MLGCTSIARVVVLVTLAGVSGCVEIPPPEVRECDPVLAVTVCGNGDRWQCEWGRVHAGRGSVDSLRALLAEPGGDHDAILRRLFPAIGDKPIVDEPIPVPEGLVFAHPVFGAYQIPVPVDWAADPFENVSWRFNFQSFHWFDVYMTGDLDQLDAGAALLVDWVDQALHAEPALEQTWNDHAIAKRLDRTGRLLDRYIADRPVLNRRVLDAGAQLVLTHLYGLAADVCYTPRHNHGMMQDLAILSWAPRFPALRDAESFWEHAQERMLVDQVRKSVTADGVHTENTGVYHLFFITLLNGAIRVHLDAGLEVPAELIESRDAMFDPLVRLLQPDWTFAQFGDETNADVTAELIALLADTRDLGVGDPAVRQPLDWLLSDGERGVPPRALDRVFDLGGYATFRDRWDPAAATTAHFKTSHLSSAHYHADDTAFEIFAHGRALLVEPGSFTYNDSDPFWRYQRSPAAQNVLVVDDLGDDGSIEGWTDASRIVAHGGDDEVAWVQGTHPNFARAGVTSLVRSFAYAKPDTFVVIDHVRAPDRHDYAQHFHLHPDLTELGVVGRTVVAAVPDGPSLSITAAVAPAAIETPIGVEDGAVMKGWYFPAFLSRVPAYDVVLRHRGRGLDLPVVIVVTPPGAPARIPTDVEYRDQGAVVTVTWRLDGEAHSVGVPAP
jgi:hypothetical protein